MAIFLLILAATAQAAPLPRAVREALHQAGIPQASVGIFVQDTASKEIVLGHRSSQPMSPASTMKLITSYAALGLLGPAYTWKTEVATGAAVAGDVLNGDLVIKGYGDPALTLEGFANLLRDVRRLGIREVRGDVLLDYSHFQTSGGDPGAFDNEPHRPYNVQPDALLVNFKTVRFRLVPEASAGIRVIADPQPARLHIANGLQVLDEPCGDWREGITTEVLKNPDGTVLVNLSGAYSSACGENSLYLALFDNTAQIEALFRDLWGELGGTLGGSVRAGAAPAEARLLAQRESRTLAETLRGINKYSNNVMARQLLLTIGREIDGDGSAQGASRIVARWLAEQGLDFPELEMENGSGLSRSERITPAHLGSLLVAAYRSPLMAEFVSSLPIAAVDGTMKKRLRDKKVAGRAHIKTGSLRGVKAIAGYVHDRKGRGVAVVFMINHPDASAGQAAQDALLEWIYNRN